MESSQSQNRRVTYRLYPNQAQEAEMLKIRALHQQLYNAALEQRITAYRRCGVSLNFAQQCKDLTDLRQAMPEYEALNAQSCQVTARLSPSVQLLTSLTAAVLKRLEHAFQHFFRRVKENAEKVGFPRFKPLQRYSGWGFKTHGDGWRLFPQKKHGFLKLSGVGYIQIRGQARTLGIPKTLDILYKGGKWYASVVLACEPERNPKEHEPPLVKGAVGLDWGVESFATLAHDSGDYSRIENERHLRLELQKLAQLQRTMSHKKLGSRNWHKAKKKVAALHSKIARKRHEFLHQSSALVVKANGLIAVEKLNTKGMTAKGGQRKKGLNREILSTAPGAFHTMLKYKAAEAGTRYIEVPTRKVKPSQTCSGCGNQAKKPLSERQHTCPCGLTLSRDQNAARVILNWALESFKGRESALCGEKYFSAKHETPSIPFRVGGM
jgi:putative transposase